MRLGMMASTIVATALNRRSTHPMRYAKVVAQYAHNVARIRR